MSKFNIALALAALLILPSALTACRERTVTTVDPMPSVTVPVQTTPVVVTPSAGSLPVSDCDGNIYRHHRCPLV